MPAKNGPKNFVHSCTMYEIVLLEIPVAIQKKENKNEFHNGTSKK